MNRQLNGKGADDKASQAGVGYGGKTDWWSFADYIMQTYARTVAFEVGDYVYLL